MQVLQTTSTPLHCSEQAMLQLFPLCLDLQLFPSVIQCDSSIELLFATDHISFLWPWVHAGVTSKVPCRGDKDVRRTSRRRLRCHPNTILSGEIQVTQYALHHSLDVDGLSVSPCGILVNSYRPYGTRNSIWYIKPSSTKTWKYPWDKSSAEKYIAPDNASDVSSILGRGKESFTVRSFNDSLCIISKCCLCFSRTMGLAKLLLDGWRMFWSNIYFNISVTSFPCKGWILLTGSLIFWPSVNPISWGMIIHYIICPFRKTHPCAYAAD